MTSNKKNYTAPLTVLTSLFFMWGFLTCLNDIMIPHLKGIFDLNYTQSMLIQFVFFAAYFICSVPSGKLVKAVGYKTGIIIGLLIAAAGAGLFYPSASMQSYNLFLAGFFILAAGITLLQVAANPFVAILGTPETSSSRLNLTQAFNSLGTTVAPLFGHWLILSVITESMTPLAKAEAVQVPYLLLAAALVILAVLIGFFKLPTISGGSADGDERTDDGFDKLHKSAWAYKHLYLGVIAIFAYVGAEVAIGSFLILFFEDPNIAGISHAAGAKYVSIFWGGAMIGRFYGAIWLSDKGSKSRKYVTSAVVSVGAFLVGWYLTKDIALGAVFWGFSTANLIAFQFGKNDPYRTLGVFSFCTVALVLITVVVSGPFAMWSILAVGFFNSIMFPTIFTLGVKKLGRHTPQGSGALCVGIVGGALVPLASGAVADAVNIQLSFLVPAACYLYITFYAFVGSKIEAA
ncbi:MAG: sugar MFS transporter [Deltaproteobacteria bacterium]|nr:sugar MFS transporter [Deltaproteobacteria bacterium]MBN2674026.1 sugar MFS transporter [Deltaproteobacteria bacterium]